MKLFSCLERHLMERPDKVAVADRETALTYAALISAARRLAARLTRERVRGGIVGVMADRSAGTVVCLLAATFAGAAYVPLDPDLPAEKREKIFADTGMRVCLAPAPPAFEIPALCLTPADAAAEECPFPAPAPGEILSIIYTSGSTGAPKGVVKTLGAMEAFLDAYQARFDFRESEVIGNQTPFFFDASAKDLYLSLAAGMTLEILPTELFTLPPALIEYMNARRVSFISWVPTALGVVAQLKTFSFIRPECLRRVFFVGEVMPVKYLNYWMDALPGAQFVNLYGSSELAGVCCACEISRRYGEDEALPLGTPLSHCRVTLEGVIGGVGEIAVESPSLARGYFRDEEKTRRRFPVREGKTVFLTGDLARYDARGNLVFVSRADFQIKHQGRRIELGEIEAAAASLPGVRRCACVYDAGKKKIVLFCECDAPDGRAIRRLLREKLSAYMVPERVVPLSSLPLNANGKIDRQRLLTPEFINQRKEV